MNFQKLFGFIFAVIFFASFASAQKAEITISLNEQFFDALLDGIFQHADPLEFPLAQREINRGDTETRTNILGSIHNVRHPTNKPVSFSSFSTSFAAAERLTGANPACKESIKLLRETGGVRTAVRFRDGKIYAPLAFSGSYNPPFIGCVPFTGYAETNIELEFDRNGQRLIANARVLNVSINGTGGVGGSVIARMLQSTIDRKLNPIEILQLAKLSFVLPIQGSSRVKMQATGVRHDILNSILNVHVTYDFVKG